MIQKIEQFITEELIDVLVEDSYPSSHPVLKPTNSPYEIEEYFDRVERSKVVGVLRMIEAETSKTELLHDLQVRYNAEILWIIRIDFYLLDTLQTYLEANAWGTGNPTLFYSQIGQIVCKKLKKK